ncbi:MAG TPA: hypothetical protein VNG69_16595 [Casimicrobiaceae bacterium]|nr:hypothetical protein [Casimicrobiaceae bacterium]
MEALDGLGGAPNHRYTDNPVLLESMVSQGWSVEGDPTTNVFACMPPP